MGSCSGWRRLVEYLQVLALEVHELTAEITERVTAVAPALPAIVGRGPLTAAKILGKTAQVHRFRSKDVFALNSTTPHRYPCGHPINSGVRCRARGIFNSTPLCIASR